MPRAMTTAPGGRGTVSFRMGPGNWMVVPGYAGKGSRILVPVHWRTTMAKRKIHAKTVIEVPQIRCKHCGEPVTPTQKSIDRILEKGPKNACPMYICDCEPG